MRRLKFEELPLQIQEKMMDRQEDQGNYRSAEPFMNYLLSGRSDGGFDWDDTEEGDEFWDEVTSGDFDQFYEYHPKQVIPIKPEYLGLYKKTFKINKVRYDHKIDLDRIRELNLEYILL